MQGGPRRRVAGGVTALLLAVTGCLVVVSSAPAAALRPTAAAHVATKPSHHRKASPVRASARATAHASARVTVRARVRATARATASAHYRVPGTGHPTGRAGVTASASGVAAARATRISAATASAVRTATAHTRAQALTAARQRARQLARFRARTTAHARAVRSARLAAQHRARPVAKRLAQRRAKALAVQRARRLARLRAVDPRDPSTWMTFAPDHYTPPGGPKFNNPYAHEAKRRALLTHVIRTVNSTPGYRRPVDPKTHRVVPCPSNPRYYPSTIRIATYSIADGSFARAVEAANQRCVSVQVLMNSHLTAVTSPSWGRIERALGLRSPRHFRQQRSFAHRCSNGCLGTSVLHSKIYLFSRAGDTRDTVITGSSNMTRNAVGIQWNDLYTVSRDPALYAQFLQMFRAMLPDHRANGPWGFRAGPYTSTFYPFRAATPKTDRTMQALRSVRCTGARGGTGIHGHSVLYIAMHAWFGRRGHWLARQVRHMYDRGCYVRILYSFMSHPTYDQLEQGTGPRMVVRRVLFPGPLGIRASKYSHMKMFAAAGWVAGNRADHVVWTGSNNWVDKSLHADEVTLRIDSAWAFRKYVAHWKFMRHRRSSPYWAKFEEPQGGGRAP